MTIDGKLGTALLTIVQVLSDSMEEEEYSESTSVGWRNSYTNGTLRSTSFIK